MFRQPRYLISAISLVLTLFANGYSAQASQSDIAQPIQVSANTAELEQVYSVHSKRRDEIAKKLSLLWFEERELKADYEGTGRMGELRDIYELAAELKTVRQKIDAARAALSHENRIIQTVASLLPED